MATRRIQRGVGGVSSASELHEKLSVLAVKSPGTFRLIAAIVDGAFKAAADTRGTGRRHDPTAHRRIALVQ